MIFLLPHTIERSAERQADQDAFRCQGRSLTYAEVVEASNRLAHCLVDEGVQRGDRVALYMPRCLETSIAVFGVLKAGAAYVPIDPQTPPVGLQYILHDCGVRHLVTHETQRRSIAKLDRSSGQIESVIGIPPTADTGWRTRSWDSLVEFPAHAAPNVTCVDQDLAYIIYSSGSTGRPKGIIHTHYSGLSYARLAAHTYGIRPDDRVANHSPLHFDISTFGYFASPYAGATTTIIPDAHTRLPASLSQLIETERITIWYSVPLALIQLLLRGALESRDMSALRWVLFAGEPFPVKHLQALMQLWPWARFSNVYGPTEVNQCTFYHVPSPGEATTAGELPTLPIGRVWENTEGLVLDDHDHPVAAGEQGELLIHSPTMMHGYWGRPELNRAAFYRQPCGTHNEKVFYRTGDLVTVQEDGNYLFLGRKDRQVKVRGYRIELDGIEHALMAHADVEEAAAFVVGSSSENRRIEAAILLKAQSCVRSADLIDFAADVLPWYAVPQRIDVLDAFPRTTTGKIDRRELSNRAVAATR